MPFFLLKKSENTGIMSGRHWTIQKGIVLGFWMQSYVIGTANIWLFFFNVCFNIKVNVSKLNECYSQKYLTSVSMESVNITDLGYTWGISECE